jgi:hypothetical protein
LGEAELFHFTIWKVKKAAILNFTRVKGRIDPITIYPEDPSKRGYYVKPSV